MLKSVFLHIASLLLTLLCASAWSNSYVQAQTAQPQPNYYQLYSSLKQNRASYDTYRDSLRADINQDEWLSFIDRRATHLFGVYQRNNLAIDSLVRYFSQAPELIPNEAYDSLFHWTLDLYQDNYGDVFLYERFAEMLLPHYEAKADTSRLLALHNIAGYAKASISRSYDHDAAEDAIAHYRQNLEYGRNFENLDPTYSRVVPIDYVNLCYTMAEFKAIAPHEALALTDEFEDFLTRYDALFNEEQRQQYHAYLEMIRSTALRVHWTDENLSDVDSVALIRMYDVSPYKHASLSDFDNADDSIYYYHSHVFMEHADIDAAFRACDRILVGQLEQLAHKKKIMEDDILNVSNQMISVMSLLDKCSLPEEEKSKRTLRYVYRVTSIVQKANIDEDESFSDFILGEMASDPVVMRHIPVEMRESFLRDVAVKAQSGTYIHFNMLENIALIVFDGLMKHKPEVFLGIMGYNTLAELYDNRSSLMQYVSNAALFADLGMNKLSEITNNDYRSLTAHEFAIMRKHPEKSLQILDIDPVFAKYRDVALGHHKWYNGKGGYPESFDNTSSPWRIIIDLMTISDAIEAGTDFYGRFYRSPKTLQQMLTELKQYAGVRYNPEIVEVLLSDPELIGRIGRIISDNRRQHLNMVRLRFFLNKRS